MSGPKRSHPQIADNKCRVPLPGSMFAVGTWRQRVGTCAVSFDQLMSYRTAEAGNANGPQHGEAGTQEGD